MLRRFQAFSKCKFGERVMEEAQQRFMQGLLLWEHRIAATQFDIGCIVDKEYHYQLTLTNTTPICSKPPMLFPKEEAWLDQHLDELQSKGVIAKLQPYKQPTCITPLILVPGVQSGQAYRVYQNIIPLNKRMEA